MSMSFKKPKKTCEDRNCPFHGILSVRGRVMDGVVVSSKMDKTVVVERKYLQVSTKFRGSSAAGMRTVTASTT